MNNSILIATGPNEGTLSNVLFALNARLSAQNRIDRILILDDASGYAKPLSPEQVVACSQIAMGNDFSPEVRRRQVKSEDLQKAIPRLIVDACKEVGRNNVIVDITSGNKTASSILYASASFSRLEHIYYVSVGRKEGRFVELWKEDAPEDLHALMNLAPLKDVHELAALSHFDLIFYLDALDDIDSQITPDLSAHVHESTHHLRSALRLFFELGDDLAAMQAIGTTSEMLIGVSYRAIELVDSSATVRTLGQLRQWCGGIRDRKAPEFTREEPIAHVLDHAVEILRAWRNAAKHKNPPSFRAREIRTATNLSINVLEAIVALTKHEESSE